MYVLPILHATHVYEYGVHQVSFQIEFCVHFIRSMHVRFDQNNKKINKSLNIYFSNELNGCSTFICIYFVQKRKSLRYFTSVFYLQNNCVNLINNRNLLSFVICTGAWVGGGKRLNNGKTHLFIELLLKKATIKTINYIHSSHTRRGWSDFSIVYKIADKTWSNGSSQRQNAKLIRFRIWAYVQRLNEHDVCISIFQC